MSDFILDNDISNEGQGLSSNSINYLTEIAKWAKFLSIVGFVGLGLMFIGSIWGLTMGSSFNSQLSRGGFGGGFNLTAMSFIYLLMAALYFFPIYYLYNFAVKMGESMKSASSMSMESAFENLKSHYKFMGIFTIVILSIYALIFVFGIFAAMVS